MLGVDCTAVEHPYVAGGSAEEKVIMFVFLPALKPRTIFSWIIFLLLVPSAGGIAAEQEERGSPALLPRSLSSRSDDLTCFYCLF